LGILFRVQEYVVSWGWAPWSDLFRVDVLNMIGTSIMLMGLLAWVVTGAWDDSRVRVALSVTSALVAVTISMVTPLLWTIWRPRWLPWPRDSYTNGFHNLDKPQAWLFPIFPWTAFAFAGLAVGVLLFSEWAREREGGVFLAAAVAGVGLIYGSLWLDH